MMIVALIAADVVVGVGAAYADFPRPLIAVSMFNLLIACFFLIMSAVKIARIRR
jgi:hypothetical protein